MSIDPITQHILVEKTVQEYDLTDVSTSALVRKGVKLGIILAFIYAAYRTKKKQTEKKCDNLKGDKKAACLKANKIRALDFQLRAAKKSINLCSKTKDPKDCKEKISAKIKEIQQKIKKTKM